NEALHGEQGVVRVGYRLALGSRTDQDLAILCIRDDGGSGAMAFRVLDDLGLATFHDGDAGIGGSQVNADDLAHKSSPVKTITGCYIVACPAISRAGPRISSALSGAPGDHDHRRPDHASVEGVPLLEDFQHRV